MNITACCAFCAFACVVLYFVKRLDEGIARVLTVVLCVFLFFEVCTYIKQPLDYLRQTAQSTSFGKYLPYMVKSLCIGLICKSCEDICVSLGEAGVGGVIEGAGKLAIVITCLPLLEEIISTSSGYI